MFQKSVLEKSGLEKSCLTKMVMFPLTMVSMIVLVGCQQQSLSLDLASETASESAPHSAPESVTTRDCQNIVHDTGETEVCGQIQKVVTVGPNLLELLLALDVQPVGHAEYFPMVASTFEQPEQQIPYLGKRLTGKPKNVGTAHEPSIEAIAALQPDLILADSFKNEDDYALLSQIAPTLLFNYSDAERDWQSDLRAIAPLFNQTEQAEALIAEADQRFMTFRQDIQPLVENYPNVLMLLSEQLEQAIEIETPKSACGSLMEDLGFQVIVPKSLKDSEQTSATLSLEAIPQLDADLIIIEGYNSDVTTAASDPVAQQLQGVKQQWEANAIAQSLPATQAGNVYFTTTYLCHALLGPIGTDVFLNQLQQQLQPLLNP
ncbi:MAG: iron-siderophore ABC transporter substrate-binding protein [Cyanobacteria bacterium P01_A01_bin.116]